MNPQPPNPVAVREGFPRAGVVQVQADFLRFGDLKRNGCAGGLRLLLIEFGLCGQRRIIQRRQTSGRDVGRREA